MSLADFTQDQVEYFMVGACLCLGVYYFIRAFFFETRGAEPVTGQPQLDALLGALVPATGQAMMRAMFRNCFLFVGLVLSFFLFSLFTDSHAHRSIGSTAALFGGGILGVGAVVSMSLAGLAWAAARRWDKRVRDQLVLLLPKVVPTSLPAASISQAGFVLRLNNPLLCTVVAQLPEGEKTFLVVHKFLGQSPEDVRGAVLFLKLGLFQDGEYHERKAIFIPQRILKTLASVKAA